MRIGIAHRYDITDQQVWSGIPYYLLDSLQATGVEIENFSPLHVDEPSGHNWLRRISWRIFRRWPLVMYEPGFLKQLGRKLESSLKTRPVDVLLSIREEAIAYCQLPVGLPVVMIHDSTFAGVHEYYNTFSQLTRRSIRMGHEAHRRAIRKSTSLVYSSSWAARSAQLDYGAGPDQTQVIEFGANLDVSPTPVMVSNMISGRLSHSRISFLFVGVNWERKGGEKAVYFISKLRDAGIDAVLEVVGCDIPIAHRHLDFVRPHGFLTKSKKSEADKLYSLYKNAHFLIVPSEAECYGCVYCEANAFGLPVIAMDTGGVSQIVKHGISGFLLREDRESMELILDSVARLLKNEQEYRFMAELSRSEFDDRLNWGVFSKRLMSFLETIIDLPG